MGLPVCGSLNFSLDNSPIGVKSIFLGGDRKYVLKQFFSKQFCVLLDSNSNHLLKIYSALGTIQNSA